MESTLNMDGAINYHYEQFPPLKIDYSQLIMPGFKASDAIARYDQMLKNMHNSEIFLAPLRNQEAVISSRMEGTVSTMEEILKYEADQTNGDSNKSGHRVEAIETYLYSKALKHAQQWIEEKKPINSFLIRSLHKELLSFGRGAEFSPGQFKSEQNYIADKIQKKILFIPISPQQLVCGLEKLFDYMENNPEQPLIKTAVSHVEFEALHPFKDGNGRIGRMLITLFLWKSGTISAPHFYISGYLEEQRNHYLDLMRNVSATNDWTSWCVFFLEALEKQAIKNLMVSENIRQLYEEMKVKFRKLLGTQWHINALDFIFTNPVFRNNKFTSSSGIPASTAAKFTRLMLDNKILRQIGEPSGRRPGLYAFEPLMELLRV